MARKPEWRSRRSRYGRGSDQGRRPLPLLPALDHNQLLNLADRNGAKKLVLTLGEYYRQHGDVQIGDMLLVAGEELPD